jgi:hypothetical protein
MRLLKHKLALRRGVISRIHSVVALFVLAATMLQGLSFCLCDIQPQSCGALCEESHSHPCHSNNRNDAATTIDHDCIHLEFETLPPISQANKTIPEISDTLQFVYLNFICNINNVITIADNIKYIKTGHIPDKCPPQLIYISKSIKVLC